MKKKGEGFIFGGNMNVLGGGDTVQMFSHLL